MRYRNRPSRLNIVPERLNRRLEGWARSIQSNAEPDYGASPRVAGFGARLAWFTVESEDLNHIVARFNGNANQVAWVAKPEDLQGYIASRDFSGISHQITPAYVLGNRITAMAIPGGSGSSFSDGGKTIPYTWEDMNNNARQWARVPT